MTNNNININHETTSKTKIHKNFSQLKLPLYETAEYIIAFFMNKIVLFGTISPLGISYFAATFPMQEMSFGTIAAFLGIIFMGVGVSSFKYIGTLALYLLFMIFYNKDISDRKWISALAGSLSLFAIGMIFVASNGFLLYDTLLLILESVLSFLSFFAFHKASIIIRTIKSREILESSEILSLIFLFSSLLLSISSSPNLSGAGQVLAVLIILSVALSTDAPLSCVTGLLFGSVLSINSLFPAQIICTYAASGLCAGIFAPKGKIATCLAFVFTNAAITLYFNASSFTLINISCTLLATAVVLLMPNSVFAHLSDFAKKQIITSKNESTDCTSFVLCSKIEEYAKSFKSLSDIFSDITYKNTQTNNHSAGVIFDSAFCDVCKNCSLCTYCWNKNYDKTTNLVSEMFSQMSTRGYATEFDAPCELRSSCIHFDDFLESVNKYYEIHKINLTWASKVCESKMLLADQFRNISLALENMKNKVSCGVCSDSLLEKKIITQLDKKGIHANDVKVIFSDCCEISLSVSPYVESTAFFNLISSSIGAVVDTPVFCASRKTDGKNCFMKFMEKANFIVEIGFAKISPEGRTKSGDSHIFSHIGDNKYVIAISDGMGHDNEAANQSKTTTHLIKKLLSSGFEKETALKIINTFLLYKSQKETYATADICVINLHSASLEFLKSGACNTYIKSGENVKIITSDSLPAGAVPSLCCDCDFCYGKNGDYIVMLTDGISDVLDTDSEDIISEITKKFSGNSPQELADEIINAAINKSEDKISDDMTILVAKISHAM